MSEESRMRDPATLSDEEWRERLTEEQYRIARRGGTEPPFTGIYLDTETPGTYRCACCGGELFRSDAKFHSGSGWPSFTAPARPEAVATREDRSHGMRRTEVLCARCRAHLGHVFPDGPAPTGLRFCVNSASLDLEPAETAPADRGPADSVEDRRGDEPG